MRPTCAAGCMRHMRAAGVRHAMQQATHTSQHTRNVWHSVCTMYAQCMHNVCTMYAQQCGRQCNNAIQEHQSAVLQPGSVQVDFSVFLFFCSHVWLHVARISRICCMYVSTCRCMSHYDEQQTCLPGHVDVCRHADRRVRRHVYRHVYRAACLREQREELCKVVGAVCVLRIVVCMLRIYYTYAAHTQHMLNVGCCVHACVYDAMLHVRGMQHIQCLDCGTKKNSARGHCCGAR